MRAVEVVPVVDEGVGNAAYLIALGAGGLAVDAGKTLEACW